MGPSHVKRKRYSAPPRWPGGAKHIEIDLLSTAADRPLQDAHEPAARLNSRGDV